MEPGNRVVASDEQLYGNGRLDDVVHQTVKLTRGMQSTLSLNAFDRKAMDAIEGALELGFEFAVRPRASRKEQFKELMFQLDR